DSHGTYIVDGAAHVSGDQLLIGATGGTNMATHYGDGRFEIHSGSVVFNDVVVGDSVTGINELLILNPEANVEIYESFLLGPTASLTAVPGATIRMTGANFAIQSRQPEELHGLNHLTVQFEGGNTAAGSLEVGGQDFGPILEGFHDNFSFRSLVVGGDTAGSVLFLDAFDNMTGNEAVYIGNIDIGPDSILDLNGFTVYYRNLSIDSAATVVLSGGQLIHVVPEPNSCVLAVLIGYALMITFGRKRWTVCE
ncbi:MAG: hypothetical protein JW829_13450, partial [Pirellulales bacterium]|nr:hypothetical protein [Pirellulales bacterium]